MRRLILVPLLIVIGVLAIAGGISYWVYNNYTYYTTDDAQVTGPIVNISSPASGQLTNFSAQLGDTTTVGETLGTISTVSTTGTKATVNITSPIAGTVIESTAVQGQVVTPGLELFQIANLHALTVTAYVNESAISNVKVNQSVDIHIDAYGGTSYSGHVQSIVQATAGTFSLLPTTDNTSGNFTKVSQRVPVIVALDSSSDNDLVPGLSAEVTIHLH